MEFRDEYNNDIRFSFTDFFTEKDSNSTSLRFDVNIHVDEFVGSLKEIWFYLETLNCFKESLLELLRGCFRSGKRSGFICSEPHLHMSFHQYDACFCVTKR